MRYVLIYVLLALVLVGVRYVTHDVRVQLRAAADREEVLIAQRDTLEVQVQALTTPQRIREWAFAEGMRRFAEAPKVTADLPTIPLPPTLTSSPPESGDAGLSLSPVPQTTLEVRTQWK